MDWAKKNKISLIAIALSTIAICLSFFRFEPFVFTESSLNWTLSIIVGIVGIAVSVALVTQIWTAMNISPMIDKKLADMRKEITEATKLQSEDDRFFAMALMSQGTAFRALDKKLYNLYLKSSIMEINALGLRRDLTLCEKAVDNLTLSIYEQMQKSSDFAVNPGDISSLIFLLNAKGVNTAHLVRAISALPVNENIPPIESAK